MSDERRLRWLCRRGMKELDEPLARFIDGSLVGLNPDERKALASLLQRQDPELYAFLLGRASPDDPVEADIVRRIVAQAKHPAR